MKALKVLATIGFLLQINSVFSQFIANAGIDRFICMSWNGISSIQIGGNPIATGGVPPYTIIWEARYVNVVGAQTYILTASDFLNDTTIPNPTVVNFIEHSVPFFLTVRDATGAISRDTVIVKPSIFGTHLGNVTFSIQQGDSVYCAGWLNVMGGQLPVTYLWRPNHGLRDSTSANFWAKPYQSTSYYVTLTDAVGCVVVGSPVYNIIVRPVNLLAENSEKKAIEIYPNPTNEILHFNFNTSVMEQILIQIYTSKGQCVDSQLLSGESCSINVAELSPGMYFYKAFRHNDNNIVQQGKFIVQRQQLL